MITLVAVALVPWWLATAASWVVVVTVTGGLARISGQYRQVNRVG